jgi:plastocyanin
LEESVRADDDGTGVFLRFALGLIAFMVLARAPADLATYRGTLATPGVVWISDGSAAPDPPPAEQTMSNVMKTFNPPVVVVRAGGSVRFPNQDPFFHSIYSESPADPFDIGFYETGPGKLVAFPTAGIIAVRCHIHGSMHGTILVVDGPSAQTTGNNEAYEIKDVLPGRHVLHVWTPEGGEVLSHVSL